VPTNPLLTAPNVVLTPHVGSRTYESVERQALMAVGTCSASCTASPRMRRPIPWSSRPALRGGVCRSSRQANHRVAPCVCHRGHSRRVTGRSAGTLPQRYPASLPSQLSKTGRSEAVALENPQSSTVTHPERHVQAALRATAAGEGWPLARSAGRRGAKCLLFFLYAHPL